VGPGARRRAGHGARARCPARSAAVQRAILPFGSRGQVFVFARGSAIARIADYRGRGTFTRLRAPAALATVVPAPGRRCRLRSRVPTGIGDGRRPVRARAVDRDVTGEHRLSGSGGAPGAAPWSSRAPSPGPLLRLAARALVAQLGGSARRSSRSVLRASLVMTRAITTKRTSRPAPMM
jgi:hypothetical protein